MRVLQINATYGYKSTGLIVKDIGDMLTQNNDEPFFAYQTKIGTVENGYQIGNKADWKMHAFLCRVLGRQGYYSTIPTYSFLKYLDTVSPDVIHLHNLHSNYINIDLLFSYIAKKDIATVITMHDCWYFTGKCFHYADIGCERFMVECGDCPKRNSPPKSVFFEQSRTMFKNKRDRLLSIPRLCVVGCSDWICNEAKKSFLKDANLVRIYNGIDTEIFKPTESDLGAKYNVGTDYLVMGMANKWCLESNQELLSKIANLDGVKLMLVGCNKVQAEELKKYGNKVICVGFISERQELARHYSCADVFVNPTHADTLPTVNMESICCGTPVVTYDSCGSPELVLDSCGIVVKENDIDSIVNIINKKMPKVDSGSLQLARLRFNKNECYKKYLRIYNECML